MSNLKEIIKAWSDKTQYMQRSIQESIVLLREFQEELDGAGYASVDLKARFKSPTSYRENVGSILEWCKTNISQEGSYAIIGGKLYFTDTNDAVLFKLSVEITDQS